MEDETCRQFSADSKKWVFRQHTFAIACMCTGGLCTQDFEIDANRYVPKRVERRTERGGAMGGSPRR